MNVQRYGELKKMSKERLARIHMRNGGLMGFDAYMNWTKEELISEILEDEKKGQRVLNIRADAGNRQAP